MIIDAHAHADEFDVFGWYDPPEKVIALMDKAGIDISIVTTYADCPGPAPGLENLLRYVEAYPKRLIGFVRIDPKYGEKAIELFAEAIRNHNLLRGLKLHPISNVVKPFSPVCVKLLKKAGELGAPAFFHCGDRSLAQPLQIAKAAEKCPETTFICHMGGYFHAEESIRAAEKNKNIILDTSSTPYPNMIKKAVEILGPKRIVFATDNPAGDPISELEKIKMLKFPREAEERILGRNIAEIVHVQWEGN